MRSTITSLVTAAVIVGLLAASWLVVRDTDWYASLSEEEVADELPSDLTEVFNTAVATRADVSDIEELDATLNYVGRVQFTHRIDPVISTTTQTVGGGRNAQTITTTIETPGSRAITNLPLVGDLLAPGEVLYETDSTPVHLATGDVAAFRTMTEGQSGVDIAQLQSFLIDSGWDVTGELEASGTWSTATTAAVVAWQTDTSQEVTGEVALGDIWFVAGPIRIVSIDATEGLVVSDGDAILTYTSTDRRVETSVAQVPEGLLGASALTARLSTGDDVTAALVSVRGTDSGFDLAFSVELDEIEIEAFNRLPVTVSWTQNQVSNELTLPPEALKRVDSGSYVVDVLEGDLITRVPVEIIGQAGRVVAVTGIDERATVLIP